MTPLLLGVAGICTRCCSRPIRLQPNIFVRSVSRTSAINRGIRESQSNSSDRRNDNVSRKRDAPAPRGRVRDAFDLQHEESFKGSSPGFLSSLRKKRQLPSQSRNDANGKRGTQFSNDRNDKRPKKDAKMAKRLTKREREKLQSEEGVQDRGHGKAAEKSGQESRRTEKHNAREKVAWNNDVDSRPSRSTGQNARVVPSPRDALSEQEVDTEFASSPNQRSFPKREEVKAERQQHDNFPVAIPFSTASSQFLYGTNAVLAALRGNRRKIYQLILKKPDKKDPRSELSARHRLVSLSREAGATINEQRDNRLLDRLSAGRPHNGVVLEVSPLSAPPGEYLHRPHPASNTVRVELRSQSAEDIAVNGDTFNLSYNSRSWRQPFVLFLDGITDPGNIGGILRTAHFYGVDAVAVATNTCANLNSPVLAKSSSGACEAIPVIAVSKPANFISDSAKQGWRICAAVAPEKQSHKLHKQLTPASIALTNPLAKHPCILMLGSEGEGLRANLRTKADLNVTIPRGVSTPSPVGVDSVNVGVAGAVLVEAFMREPLKVAAAGRESMF